MATVSGCPLKDAHRKSQCRYRSSNVIELTLSTCQKDTYHAIVELIAWARGSMFGIALQCAVDLTKNSKCSRVCGVGCRMLDDRETSARQGFRGIGFVFGKMHPIVISILIGLADRDRFSQGSARRNRSRLAPRTRRWHRYGS
jgi:hypothetical protein